MSYQQGLQIGNALMGMGTAIGGAIDRQRDNAWQNRVQKRQEQTWQRQDQQYNQENAYNQQLNSYLSALQQDPNYEPERIDATNAKAWWDASYRVTTQRLEEAKTKGYLDDQKISQLKAKNTEGLDLAKKFISAPEGENKKRMGVEWWNKYYDNGQLVEEMPGSDKMRVRSILTGKQREMPSLSAEQIETTMKDYYGKRGLPQKRSMVEAQAINIANKKILSSPKTYVDEKGMVVYYVDGVIDPKTKEINSYYTLRPPQMDAPLTVDQVAAAGFDFDSARMISGPPSPKDQAEIGLKQAQTQKTQADTKKIQAETQAIQRGGNQDPNKNISSMKLAAWQAYFNDTASPQQQRLIGVDKDPNIQQAMSVLKDDIRFSTLPTDQKVSRINEVANDFRTMSNPATASPQQGAISRPTPPKTGQQKTTQPMSPYKDVPTAVNKQTGERRYWDGSEWIPLTYDRR